LLKGATNQMEKAKKIYEYVTNNFTCTDHSQLFPGQSLKKLMDKKNGGVAEINLLLTAMFRQAGLLADPVILSTRQNGYVQEDYPVAGRFNYVISRANINGQDMLFDATRDGMGFGKLHYDCYNGQARVVNEAATEISLKSDQLTEKKVLSLFATNDSNKKWAAHVSKLYGYYESNEVRKKAKLPGQESLLTELSNEFGTDIRVENLKVDSLTIIEEPVTVQFDISFKNETEDILYVNPLIMGRYKENPFKSADRQYPVELPYKVNEIYTLNMPVPEGYIVDEMPKPLTIKLNPNNDAVFEYNISKSGSQIMMRCKLEINRTIFYAAEYNSLREFFGMLVAKQNEQIVFKRK